jgi:hypothetical protein
MLKDIPENSVEGVHVAIVQEKNTLGDLIWNAYLINKNDYPLENILIMSNGSGTIGGIEKKTSTLRKMIDTLFPCNIALIEPVDPVTFALTTEFKITYYRGRAIHDARFVFEANVINENDLIYIPEVDKKGIIVP